MFPTHRVRQYKPIQLVVAKDEVAAQEMALHRAQEEQSSLAALLNQREQGAARTLKIIFSLFLGITHRRIYRALLAQR
jgi:hypothetical protein